MYRKNTINGFTIVELLIVIVVIGILASITIVSFNGVQQRAKTTQTVAIAKAYINALKLWEADKGSLPLNESCLGPATAFSATSNTCYAHSWTGNAPYLPTFNTDLGKYIGKPTGELGVFGPPAPSGTMWYHGNWYGQNKAVLGYAIPRSSNDCGLPNILSQPYDNATVTGAKYTEQLDAGAYTYTYCLVLVGTR